MTRCQAELGTIFERGTYCWVFASSLFLVFFQVATCKQQCALRIVVTVHVQDHDVHAGRERQTASDALR